MPQHPLRRVCFALGAGLALVLGPPALRAADPQLPKPNQVKFFTADQVELHGKFYPGSKKTDAPCILLLTEIGGNINEKGWDSLAKKLQAKGYPVLAFDFRGHGESTRVDPQIFWQNATNRNLIKGFRLAKPPETINWKDFSPAYYPTLVNDITAAKAFLDTLNDKGDVNAANVVVIGSQSGGVLGSIWVNEEFHRYRLVGRLLSQTDPQPEGKDIYAAVWLSLNPSVGRTRINVSPLAMLRACRDKKVPMAFLYGEKDTTSKRIAKEAVEMLRPKKKSNKVTIGQKAIPGSEKAKGRELLAKDLDTESRILKFLDDIIQDKVQNTYESPRDFRKAGYAWKIGARAFLAKQPGETTLLPVPAILFSR